MGFAVQRTDSPSAAAALAASGAIVVSGGTLAIRAVNEGRLVPTSLVSLHGPAFTGIARDGDTLCIGAATRVADLAVPDLAFLADLLRDFGSPTLRNMATVGGNLFARQPYGDLGVALLALGADVELAGQGSSRTLPIEAFLAEEPAQGEVLVSLRVALPAPGGFHWTKATRRRLNSAAIVSIAALVDLDGAGLVRSARIALGGADARPVRSPAAEAALAGRPLDPASVEAAGRAAAAAHPFFTDAYASDWYRRRVLPVHLRRALLGA